MIILWILLGLVIAAWLGGWVYLLGLYNLVGPVDRKMMFEALAWPYWALRAGINRVFRD